jgi:hypothetical protein
VYAEQEALCDAAFTSTAADRSSDIPVGERRCSFPDGAAGGNNFASQPIQKIL